MHPEWCYKPHHTTAPCRTLATTTWQAVTQRRMSGGLVTRVVQLTLICTEMWFGTLKKILFRFFVD